MFAARSYSKRGGLLNDSTMEEQRLFREKLLKSLKTAGFTIDQDQELTSGSASFATLHPRMPVRIDFDAYSSGISFTVTLGTVCFQKVFAYQYLMTFPSDADVIIPIILRTMFRELGEQLAVNYYKTINPNKLK